MAQPQALLVYDCEALFWRRIERQAQIVSDEAERLSLRHAAQVMRTLEDRIAVEADLAITVSTDEAQLLAAIQGSCPLKTLVPSEPSVAVGTRGFHERVGVAFVAGWLAGSTSPNADGLRWFVSEVLPLVREQIPWVRVCVTGANPPDDLLALADPNLFFEGHVEDLALFYDRTRVVIAPIRFGAGVKVKTVQALQYGVPVVSTSCGAEGIDTFGLPAIATADTPSEFAGRLIELLTDRQAWDTQRTVIANLLERWNNDSGSGSWSEVIAEALSRRHGGNTDLFVQR
jgi:hypothetical protein